jgi:hypothetical protein
MFTFLSLEPIGEKKEMLFALCAGRDPSYLEDELILLVKYLGKNP